MSENMYPAEQPVDLRSARKITPTGADQPASSESDVFGEGFDADTYVPAPAEIADSAAAESAPAVNSAGAALWERDLLAAPAAQVAADPARWGRRGRANRLLGPLVRLSPTAAEVDYRRAEATLRTPLTGRHMVMVANCKGGQGKTTTALMLAHTLATYRRAGSAPVVWDNAESEGTLGYRCSAGGSATVWDLLGGADTVMSPYAEASTLSRFLRVEPTGVEILASDDSAARLEQIGAQHCRTLYAALRRWRELVIVDTGNNRRRSNWLWTAHTAQQLVIPLVYAADSGMTVLKMLAALRERGLDRLVDTAIVVAAPPAAGIDDQLREHLRKALYGNGIAALFEVPHDPVLARGGRIDYPQLPEMTRRAWTSVAGHVAASLAAHTPPADPPLPTWTTGPHQPTGLGGGGSMDAAARIAQLEAELAAATARQRPDLPRRIG